MFSSRFSFTSVLLMILFAFVSIPAQAMNPLGMAPHYDKGTSSSGGGPRVRNRDDYRIVIFTDDQPRAQAFLRALKARGYTNSKVRDSPNSDFNIKWGHARTRMVNEILSLADRSLGIDEGDFNRKKIFGDDDKDIFVNLPFGSTGGGGSDSARAKHKVVIFTDDQARAQPLLDKLQRMGYTNSHFNSPPNSDFNIKWGSATSARVNEIVRAITDTTGIASSRVNRKKIFGDTDTDIFINLPFGSSGPDRSKHEVVIFTDDEDRAQPLVRALESKGYRARARGNPNDNFNIKWGSATDTVVDEIVRLISSRADVPRSEINRKHIFGEDDDKIFVNLPFDTLASSGGGRSSYRVVIFTDDRSRARTLERALHRKGYTNTAMRDTPNSDFNIKWGEAGSSTVNEIVSLITSSVDVPRSRINRKHIFEENDKDIFINLPFSNLGGSAGGAGSRGEYEVTIFTNDQSRARALKRALERRGYGDVSMQGGPNSDFNIKWGRASRSMVNEIVRLIEDTVDVDQDDVNRKHIFEPNDNDIFINLPF